MKRPAIHTNVPAEVTPPSLRELVEGLQEAFFALDRGWRLACVNRKAEAVFGRSGEELQGRCLWDEFPEVVTTPLYDELQKVAAGKEEARFEALFAPNYRHLALRVVPSSTGLLVFFIDITDTRAASKVKEQVNVLLEQRVKERTDQLEQANKRLLHDAFHDTLTGMPNRAFLNDRLGHLLGSGEGVGAVLFLDFDRFKVVNDSLGHPVGDALLVAIGECLEACVRPSDTVARLGGDEFAILLESAESAQDAVSVVERIQERLAQPFRIYGHTLHITASVGIVMLSASYRHAQEVLRDADLAMYRAKAQGKARYAVFDSAMRDRAMALMSMESDLRLALERNQFQVHYQPVIQLESRKVVGFEALARWQHPRHGFISPAEFIPLAEETGLIHRIDRWVLGEACRQLARWQGEFRHQPPLKLSVNFSSQQFQQPDLASRVHHVLWETGFAAELLNIEITETLMMDNTACVQGNLKALEQLGVGLHLDDFGTGYSSLGYLQRFPAHSIKIDRSFVDRLEGTPESAELVRTLISMAHNLEMGVVAEGVETLGQLEKLREMACEYVQGYLFARPMSTLHVRDYLMQLRH